MVRMKTTQPNNSKHPAMFVTQSIINALWSSLNLSLSSKSFTSFTYRNCNLLFLHDTNWVPMRERISVLNIASKAPRM